VVSHVLDGQEYEIPHQSEPAASCWRADGRCGATGRKDYCRYIWRVQAGTVAARFGQGSFEGRSFGLLTWRGTWRRSGCSGRARKVEVQLAYAIGVGRSSFGHGGDIWHRRDSRWGDHRPDSQHIQTDAAAESLSRSIFGGPIYRPTASFGHFRALRPRITWERTDKADAIRSQAGLWRKRSSRSTLAITDLRQRYIDIPHNRRTFRVTKTAQG